MKQRDDRIEELEEALKESVSITADREMVLAQQTQTITNLQRQVRSDFVVVYLFILVVKQTLLQCWKCRGRAVKSTEVKLWCI